MSPIETMLACFAVASLAGIARAMRRGEKIRVQQLIGTALYSGAIGLVIGLLLFEQVGPSRWPLLVGVSGLAGIGGGDVLDFLVHLLTGGSVSIHVRHDKKDDTDAP